MRKFRGQIFEGFRNEIGERPVSPLLGAEPVLVQNFWRDLE